VPRPRGQITPWQRSGPGDVHTLAGLAFLDEEQEELVVADEPERPRRRVGGPQRRRQQFLVRRLIGVGVGLAFLILIVIGIRGCLEARSDRGLRNYASDVATIVQQSEQSGTDFFDLLNSPTGGSSSLDVKNQILAQRDNSQALLDRAENLGAPGQMKEAQSALDMTLTLRRNALDAIASNVQQAAARTETANAISRISDAMGSLYASDVVWTQVGSPEIKQVLDEEGVDAPALPPGNFMPSNATDFLDQTTLVTKLDVITGQQTTSGGVHGLQLLQTSIGGTTLAADSTTTVPASSQELEIQVQNSGDSDETDINVTVTLNGNELQGQIPALSAGESGTVKIPLATKPPPGSDVTLEVVVQPVLGEQVADNNQASYTIVFS
jgi:CARDB